MQSIFATNNGISPVKQDFVWLGEYFDGTHSAEFDLLTGQENSFYTIDRNKLLRFGLIGHGLKLFFEHDGVFNLGGIGIEVIYKVGNKEYYLTGQPGGNYADVITFKDAESSVDLTGSRGLTDTVITQYSFGYKANLKVDGIDFKFKALCKVPFGAPMYMNFWLVANKNMNGKIVIKRNNRVVQEIDSPLKKSKGGEVNYLLT